MTASALNRRAVVATLLENRDDLLVVTGPVTMTRTTTCGQRWGVPP